MANEPKVPTQPTANQPLTIVKGKPYVHDYPTPNPNDRVFYIRRDSRLEQFKTPPKPGTPFDGKGDFVKLLKDFVFATAKPADEAGQVNWFYVNERQNQDAYNYQIEFPYVDKRYPKITRTVVVFRTDDLAAREPVADTKDNVFSELLLTDHKITRFEDPVMDSVFVTVTRTFERLPGPVITSFKNNQFQQTVAVKTQEVVRSTPPSQSATTENVAQERTGTAKAKNTAESVDKLFPADAYTTEIPSMVRELWMGGFTEETHQQMQAAQAAQGILVPGTYSVTEKQVSLFKKEVTIKTLPLPQTRLHQEMTEEFGGGILDEQLDLAASGLSVIAGYLVTESKLRNLDGFGQVRMMKTLSDGTEWPPMYETETDPKLGIIIQIRKQYIPGGIIFPPGYHVGVDEKFVDIKAHSKYRSIQIVSKVDPSTLPPPVQWRTIEHVNLPATILAIGNAFHDTISTSAKGELHGPNIGVDGSGSMFLQTHTRNKTRACISRAFESSEGVQVLSSAGNFEIVSSRPYLDYLQATVTRIVTLGPPDFNAPPFTSFPFNFLFLTPVTGMATVIERSHKEAEMDGVDRNELESTTDVNIRVHEFGPVLVGVDGHGVSLSTTDKSATGEIFLDAQNSIQYSGPVGQRVAIYRHYNPSHLVSASSVVANTTNSVFPFRNTSINSAALGSNVVAEVRLMLPPSNPTRIAPGFSLVVKSITEEWRLGVFVTYITTVTLP